MQHFLYDPQKVNITGVPISRASRRDFVLSVVESMMQGRGGWCCTVNLDILRQWNQVPEIRDLLSTVTDNVADGSPIVWAARLMGVSLERVCGSDLVYDLTEAAARAGRSIYFLGGNPGTADRAASILKVQYPGLSVVGTACPPFGFENSPSELTKIIDAVVSANPDIVYVGLGFPKQERLIYQLRKHHPRAWYVGVGISFSFVAGEVRRAPRYLQAIGMEWLHRLFQEPQRLWRRYLLEDIPFFLWLLPQLILEKSQKSKSSSDL